MKKPCRRTEARFSLFLCSPSRAQHVYCAITTTQAASYVLLVTQKKACTVYPYRVSNSSYVLYTRISLLIFDLDTNLDLDFFQRIFFKNFARSRTIDQHNLDLSSIFLFFSFFLPPSFVSTKQSKKEKTVLSS